MAFSGVVMSSDYAHTITQHPLAHTPGTCTLICRSCALFTGYPNRIMYWHPTPLHVITTRAREGEPKERRAKQKWPR